MEPDIICDFKDKTVKFLEIINISRFSKNFNNSLLEQICKKLKPTDESICVNIQTTSVFL